MRPDPAAQRRSAWRRLVDEFAIMSVYERFEQAMALLLSGVLAAIIVVSMLQLMRTVFNLLVLGAFDPLEHATFQTVFGMILTLLIAMEFKHSIIKVALRRENIIQVRTVLLIALIALSRKFVIFDPETSPAELAALAGAVLALGVVYWLLGERDDRLRRALLLQQEAGCRSDPKDTP